MNSSDYTKPKRITLMAGHYGSGKTNIAVNYALWMKKHYDKVVIADIDIVNPYFRTKDSEKELTDAGIDVISLPFANSNVDLPSLPSSLYSVFQNKERMAILDVGGDDRGAYALGRYVPSILTEQNYNMVYVVNFYRPLTPDVESAIEVMREIELACTIKCTAIINNSNLGPETTVQDVISTDVLAKQLSEKTGLPILMTTVEEKLLSQVSEELENVFPLKLQKKIIDEQ